MKYLRYLLIIIGALFGSASANIVDDEQQGMAGTLQFSSATYSVNENDGSVSVTVTRVDGSDGAISVDYVSLGGTARPGKDYTRTRGTLNWGDGDASDKTFTVDITDDSISEGDETIKLRLIRATGGATLGDPAKAVVTIVDDDLQGMPGTLQFSSATYSVNENDGSISITVTRVDGSDGAISVGYISLGGTARPGRDYTRTGGTLNWGDGDASDKTFTVDITDDSISEGDETIKLRLIRATGGATLGDPAKAVVTIVDDDLQGMPGTLQFSSATYSVNENDGSVSITVTRVDGSDGAISVNYVSLGGTARPGRDYTRTRGTLNWDDGDADDKTFAVDIIDDSISEGDETIRLRLIRATGGATLGDPAKAVVTIVDDDQQANHGTLQFSSATYSVNENDGSVSITVTRVDGSDGAISVDYISLGGTARPRKDYTRTRGTLNWDDGDADDKTFAVAIIDDSISEGDETIKLRLIRATGGATLGDPVKAVVTIVDDD
jgi:hypothetical protein